MGATWPLLQASFGFIALIYFRLQSVANSLLYQRLQKAGKASPALPTHDNFRPHEWTGRVKPPTLPALIEEMLTFRDILQEKSQNKDIIILESFALALMNDHELYPPKGTWRVFEIGVRNCTGQAFAVKELRTFLALFAREFDF
ncbi:hypothetical protein F4824DRAFT_498516 [Ustulina deusta]|nr:hypothetical protein F4824DRAFT_498516 [Ustulina deusta]